jgi:subtilisin family serine protease
MNSIWRLIFALQPLVAFGLNLVTAGQTNESADRTYGSPNDPLFEKQENLFRKLNVFEAWRFTRGDSNVLVGIIDNGFDFFHPDLKGNLSPGFYAPNVYHTEVLENVAHGTLVASLIVAVSDNGIGMSGLAPGCRAVAAAHGTIEHELAKLMQEFRADHPEAGPGEFNKVLRAHPELKEFGLKWRQFVYATMAQAIRDLVDRKVKVINMSQFLKPGLCPAETQGAFAGAFDYALENDVVLVLGAGNNGTLCEDYPGKPEAVIVVGSILMDDTRWEEVHDVQGTKIKEGSNYGTRLAVVAPTEGLQVCWPHDKRFYASVDGPMGPTHAEFEGAYRTAGKGTSCAAPIVTALVALVRSIRPDLDARSVVEIVKRGCEDIGEPGFDIHTGYGRVDFGKTITLARTWKREPPEE